MPQIRSDRNKDDAGEANFAIRIKPDAAANTLTIGTGATLNITSNSTLIDLNQTVNAAFLVGSPNIFAPITTVLTVNGGGTLNVNGGLNNSSFIVGVGNANTNLSVASTTLDLSGLSNFTFTTGAGAVPVSADSFAKSATYPGY